MNLIFMFTIMCLGFWCLAMTYTSHYMRKMIEELEEHNSEICDWLIVLQRSLEGTQKDLTNLQAGYMVISEVPERMPGNP